MEARHQRRLSRIQREDELRTASGRAPAIGEIDMSAAPSVPAQGEAVNQSAAGPSGDVRVPAGAATVAQWAMTWVSMCADGERALGPLSDKDARARYGMTARQLRNIRQAAISGVLRRRAAELRVPLPAGYDENPTAGHINGKSAVAMLQ